MNEPRRMCATPLQVLMNPALGRKAPAEVPYRCLSGAAPRNRTTTDGAGRSITAPAPSAATAFLPLLSNKRGRKALLSCRTTARR